MKNIFSRNILSSSHSIKRQQGVVSIIFATSLVAIISIILISANTAYISIKNSRLEQANESAVIAIGLAGSGSTNNPLSMNDYRQIVTSILASFFPTSYQKIDFIITPPKKEGDPYTLDTEMKFDFIGHSWLSSHDFSSNSQVKLDSKIGVDVVQGNIEISMIMDNSGSMYADIDTLKDSAKFFINQLIDNRSNPEQVYISIVPFSYSVNIGKQNLSWISSSLSGNATTFGACTNYRYNSPPATQIIANAIVPPIATSANSKKFPGYSAGTFAACAETPLLGLTNNKSLLLPKVDDMVASGATDGDQGIIWGWRTLTEDWLGLWPSTTTRPLPKTDVKKVALFFSDGASISNEREIFLPICEAMKNDDIEIYTIQFSSSNNSMRTCASNIPGKQHYFYANNQQQLKQAFVDISKNVGFELRLKKL